jgi:hypothetical protein
MLPVNLTYIAIIVSNLGEKRQKPCIEGESSIVDNTDFSPSTSSDAKPEAKTLSFLDEPPSDNLNRFIAQQADTVSIHRNNLILSYFSPRNIWILLKDIAF